MTESTENKESRKVESVLKDIELEKTTNQGVFKQYRPEAEVGDEILKEYMNTRYLKRKAVQGFYLTEENKTEIGLITQCHGLMTISTLKSFGISLLQYQSQIIDTVTYVLDMTENENFQPTPYLMQLEEDDITQEGTFIKEYVDTLASVLSALVMIRDVMYDDEFLDTIADRSILTRVDKRIIDCVRKLNKAAIKNSVQEVYTVNGDVLPNIVTKNDNIVYKGWNFAPCPDNVDSSSYDMSLYFTYEVTSAYMDLRNALGEAVTVHRDRVRHTNRITDEYLRELNLSPKFRRDMEFIESFGDDFDKFNEICVDVGHVVDKRIASDDFDITENFIGVNFTPTLFEDMVSSTTNDALFNTLEALGIVINAGIDLDYEDHSRIVYGDNREQTEYIEKLQYCIQNIQKCYKKMTQLNKEYVVDQYVLNFNENMPAQLILQAKVLRKQRISPFALTPLTIKIYNLISKYLIKYPQKQSITYLETILKNRVESDKYKWSWDVDGYNVITNYMYIDVLKDFYDYYNEYELSYSGNIPEKVRQMESEYHDKIANLERSYEAKIKEIQNQSKILKEENEKLLSKREPLIEELEALIRNEVRKQFGKAIVECFNDIAENNTEKDKDDQTKAFNNAFLSWYADAIEEIGYLDVISSSNRDSKNEMRKSLIEYARINAEAYLNTKKE